MSKQAVVMQLVSEISAGQGIEIPIRAGVDLEGLTAGDENPVFLTLEIARVGAVSGNDLLYDDELVNRLVSTINSEHTEGIMGHLKPEDRASAFPVPDVHWLGATRVGEKAYAKGYIPRTAVRARDYYRTLQMTGGKAATSFAGMAFLDPVAEMPGINRAREFELEQLDLAPFKRAALPPTGGFTLTHEMQQEDSDMGEGAELQGRVDELLGEKETLTAQIQEMRLRELRSNVTEQVTAAIDWPVTTDEGRAALKATRAIVTELAFLKTESADTAKATIDQVMETLKPVTELLVSLLSGGPAIVQALNKKGVKLEDTPENRARARSRLGV